MLWLSQEIFLIHDNNEVGLFGYEFTIFEH